MKIKTSFYKRRIKGFSKILFTLLLIFLGVFLSCLGLWYLLKNHPSLYSPLGRIISVKRSDAQIAKIQLLCFTYRLNCTSITINSNNSATLVIDSNQKVIMSLNKDLSMQLSSLQLMKDHLTIEGKQLKTADFRFDKPVISY